MGELEVENVGSESGEHVGMVVDSEEPGSGEAPVEESVGGERKVEAHAESSQLVEAVPPRTDDAEERAFEANSGDGIGATEAARDGRAEPEEEPGSQEPETREPEPAEGVVGEEPEEKAEVGEAAEEVTTSGDGEDEAVEVDTRDVNNEVGKEQQEEEASPEAPGEALDGSVDVGEKVVEVNPGEGSELAAVSAPAENGEEKSPEAVEEAPPVEEDAEDAATSGEPEIESSTSAEVEPQMPSSEIEERSATSAPLLPPEEELFDLLEWESKNHTTSVPEGVPEAEPVAAEDRALVQVEEPPHAEIAAVHEGEELDDGPQSGTVKPVGDLSHMLQTVMTDEEVKAAALAGTQVLEPETVARSGSGEGPPKASGLDEVAAHLHDAAAKALQDGEQRSSVAESVAHIVLEDSSHAKDASQYISEVVQHVAQDAGPTTAPVTQPKESSSLGTMVPLFVIWCVSLCASRVSSKDMPAPALRLAAEEVTAVLHSTAPSQPTPATPSH